MYFSNRKLISNIFENKSLLKQLCIRDFSARYKSGYLGVAWTIVNPLMMLALYSFVFVAVFKMRWGIEDTTGNSFILLLFTGILVHGFFCEFVARAPTLITSNPAYVKKVVFPLELLPVMPLLGAMVNFIVGMLLVIIMQLWINEILYSTIFLLPVIFIPFVIMLIGISYIFSALGVYFRDLTQMSGIVCTIAMFASPVLFPLDAVPENYRMLLYFNPITLIVEQVREIVILGVIPNLIYTLIYSIVAVSILCFGVIWFKVLKKGFSDVL